MAATLVCVKRLSGCTGGNEYVGRSLGRILQSAGVRNVKMKVHVALAQVGEYRRTRLLSLLESMRDLVLASGRIKKADLQEHMARLEVHLGDPGTTLIDKLVIQAWGQTSS